MFWWDHPGDPGGLDIPCLAISADGVDNHELPAIVKVRYVNDPKGGILGPLCYDRHWGALSTALAYRGSWRDKRSDCVWRGVPTGTQEEGVEPKNWKNLRMVCCYKWRDTFDIGITETWDRWHASYLKPSMSIHEMLNYKYILSIPGADKDSGLNWKLASNSVVLMAPPEIESWLMEGLLEPWVHYIPLKDDYSDLDEIVKWCRNNDDKCQEIVKNANNFIRQFGNMKVEKAIFNMIKEHYRNTFTLV